MVEHLHTVTVGGAMDYPDIKFECHGDDTADCHTFARCYCPTFNPDHRHSAANHGHCWMVDHFANDAYYPTPLELAEVGYRPGMSGPIRIELDESVFGGVVIDWRFVEERAATGPGES